MDVAIATVPDVFALWEGAVVVVSLSGAVVLTGCLGVVLECLEAWVALIGVCLYVCFWLFLTAVSGALVWIGAASGGGLGAALGLDACLGIVMECLEA